MDIKQIITAFKNLPTNKQQYIVGWLSPRYLAVIFKKCSDEEKTVFIRNMSRTKVERIDDELRTNPIELGRPKLVKAVFTTLYQAVSSDSYKNTMKDRSYKRRKA